MFEAEKGGGKFWRAKKERKPGMVISSFCFHHLEVDYDKKSIKETLSFGGHNR